MKRIFALLLCAAMLMTIFPVTANAVMPEEKPLYVYTEADNALIEEDVFASIDAVKLNAAQTCGGIGKMKEQDYIALIPQVIESVMASDTYVPGTLQQNGNFLVWQTTVGIPCCYDPRMEAELHNTENEPSAEEIAQAEARAAELLQEFSEIQGGWAGSTNIGLIQPYWESTSNYADSSFNGYSPSYKAAWQAFYAATGGEGIRYTMNNANVDNIGYTMSQCGLVMFDSHGNTDYSGYGGDYVSQANTSYLCLITNTGVTSQDTQPQQGQYGTFYHCLKGSGYAYVDGTCIGNHMPNDAPNSYLYMGICLGMATDGMEGGLRAKGVEAVWGYSQSVSFVGDEKYMKALMNYIKDGDELQEAASKVKTQFGNWDPAYSSYSYSQAVANYVAFPIVASDEDPYPGHGNVDVVQTVYSTWTLYSQYMITALSNNDAWGTVDVSGRKITATPAVGYEVAGYEVLDGTATVTQNGNVFQVEAESDCTIRINFAARIPATVSFSVPEGVSVENFQGYVNDVLTFPEPVGEPVADAYHYRFLGWAEADLAEDSEEMPVFHKAGAALTVSAPQTTYYALYKYFVAADGVTEGKFTLVTQAPASWAGDYVITYQGQKVLDATGTITGTSIGGSRAAHDLDEIGGILDGDALYNIPDDYIYSFEPAGDGAYALKMKEHEVYLALTSDSNALMTADGANRLTAKWTLSCNSQGVQIANAEYSTRTMRFNDKAKLFRCYTSGQQQIAVYSAGDGTVWYTTNPRNKTVCDEHAYGDPVWTWNEDLTAASAKFVCNLCGDVQNVAAEITEVIVSEALPHIDGERKLTAKVTFNGNEYSDEKTVQIEALPCPCAAFEDMPAYGTPEHEAIDWAFTHDPQITSGMNDTTFGYGQTLTRAQASTFLYAAAGKPEFDETAAENPFSDVKPGKWYTKPVLWAYSQGLVSGMSADTYGINNNLTRGQIMVILYAQAGKPSVEGLENPYTDVAAGKWYTDSAIWAYYAGIEQGADGKYVQNTPCTREAMVLYLYRVMTGNQLLADD